MVDWINNVIQKIMLPTRKYLNRKFGESDEKREEQVEYLKKDIQKLYIEVCNVKENIQTIIDMQKEEISIQNDLINIVCQIEKQNETNRNEFQQRISEIKADIKAESKSLITDLRLTNRTIEDANWAQIFHDTIIDSEWLVNKSFSPGRWAAGYQMLYVMYRILNEVHPQDILELGLGQSTKLIMQYSSYYQANHTVTEHDAAWIKKCKEDFSMPEHVHVAALELETISYEDDPEVLIYKDFKENIGNKKYDFICVDAPFGGHANKYARIDVLNLIPDCLNDDFVILLDDYNRVGEKNTGELIKGKLEKNGIAYEFGNYQGKKCTCVFTSKNYKFLTSL